MFSETLRLQRRDTYVFKGKDKKQYDDHVTYFHNNLNQNICSLCIFGLYTCLELKIYLTLYAGFILKLNSNDFYFIIN
jgi:hypothetical protein